MKKLICIAFILFLAFFLNTYAEKKDSLVDRSMGFIDLLQKANYNGAFEYFDSTMKTAFPVNKLQESWENIQLQVGRMDKIVKSQTSDYNDKKVVVMTAKFEKMYLDIRCVYSKDSMMAGFFIAPNYSYSDYQLPAYVKIKSYDEQKIKFGKKGWELSGILTVPKKDKEHRTQMFPVVIMVQGSGPNDMDESIGPNKPFKDIALGLASKGIATFRYNKRTQEHADKIINILDSLTIWEEVIDDAISAVETMSATSNIDPQQIYVLGHSLGGMVIPRIADKDKSINGFIIMAGNSRPLQDLLIDQYTYIFNLDGEVSKEEQANLDSITAQVARVNDPKLSKDTPMNLMPLNTPASYWMDLRDYHPAGLAKTINSKILILQGERDYQVTIKDFDLWRSELEGKPKVTFKLYPKLNHLFIEGELMSTPEEYAKVGHVAEYVLDDIVKWIKQSP